MAAPRGNTYAQGNNGGRPTLYKPEYTELVYNYCLLGATDEMLAKFFNVSITTIHNWKNEHEEFVNALKKGKELADAQVANRLYNRAIGLKIEKQQAFKVKRTSYSDGKKVADSEEIEIVMLQEELPPDTTAGIFWLKNRAAHQWSDKFVNAIVEDAEVQKSREDFMTELERKRNDKLNGEVQGE